MNIVHIIPGIGHTSFGLGQVALNLAREQNALGDEAWIWCVSPASDVQWASDSSDLARSRIRTFSAIGPSRLAFSPAMVSAAIGKNGDGIDVAHQHGIWTACSISTNTLHRYHSLPYVVAPHGSLDPWALGRSLWKKWIASIAYQDANLRSAACLHALAEKEATGFRTYGLRNPIAIIPNGISDTWLKSVGDASKFRKQFDIPADVRLMLFLSRITPKKGLPMLLQALSVATGEISDWWLVIAGADEFGHEAEVRALVDRLRMADRVRFIGPVLGQAKRDTFAAADLFVLPSFSEGAPMVILEALGAGLPVLTTRASPWRDFLEYRCGWWTDIDAAAIRDALSEAARLTKQELIEMGMRGKALVATKYTWSRVGQMTSILYEWLLGRIPQPSFVSLD